jgi:hypothetical protein
MGENVGASLLAFASIESFVVVAVESLDEFDIRLGALRNLCSQG